MALTLKLAALYNIVWGAITVLFPNVYFEWCGMDAPNYPMIWQCVGMIVGAYGLGYWWASYDPIRHWPIVAVGLVGKILGPLGYLIGVLTGTTPVLFGLTIITNDLVWWVPFGVILWRAHGKSWPLR